MRFREKATILNYIDNDDDNNYNTNGMFSQFCRASQLGEVCKRDSGIVCGQLVDARVEI